MPPPTPLPLDQLTPDRLVRVDQIHAFDPTSPGFDAWLPVPGSRRLAPGDTVRVLEVAIDRSRIDDDLAVIRGVIQGYCDSGRPG